MKCYSKHLSSTGYETSWETENAGYQHCFFLFFFSSFSLDVLKLYFLSGDCYVIGLDLTVVINIQNQ